MSLPKIFCITLKNTPNRTSYAENHFKKNKLDVTFFEGINAKNFGFSGILNVTGLSTITICSYGYLIYNHLELICVL